jgi:hypothetical protein
MPAFGTRRRVDLVRTDVSEERLTLFSFAYISTQEIEATR